METLTRRKIDRKIQDRINELRERTIDGIPFLEGEVFGSQQLGRILKVTRQTVTAWRRQKLIRSYRMAPGIYKYNLLEVASDLEKLT